MTHGRGWSECGSCNGQCVKVRECKGQHEQAAWGRGSNRVGRGKRGKRVTVGCRVEKVERV